MTAIRLALLASLAAGLTAGAYPPVPKAKENAGGNKELSKAIQGTWEVTKIERGGAGKLGAMAGYVIRVTIDGDKLTQNVTTNQGREQAPILGTFTLDAKKRPAQYVMTYARGKAQEVRLEGILKVEGDTMIWAYATGDARRPAKIDAELAAQQHRFTLKRVKK